MRAIVTIVCVATAVLVAVTAILVETHWTDAVREGKSLYPGRSLVERAAVRHSTRRPMVAWIGDSTLMVGTATVPYPTLVTRRLGADQFVEMGVFAQAGIGPFVEYCLVGKFLETDPDLIVIVANLRIMALRSDTRGFLSLASFIPGAEMARAVWLPWHHRQVTLPRLFLARALVWPDVEKALYFYEGLRLKLRDQMYRDEPVLSAGARAGARESMLRHYVAPIAAPVIRMLGAAVDLAVRNGRPTVVVVSPIPIGLLRERGLYSAAVLDHVKTIRRAVESAGGRLVDLHADLSKGEFRDPAGHFSAKGADRMAELLDPIIREELAPTWPSVRGDHHIIPPRVRRSL